MNTLTSHPKIDLAQQTLQPYLNALYRWTSDNELILNPDKSSYTLFTPDPAEYNTTLTLTINNIQIPTVKHPKILGITYDPKLNFSEHTKITKDKATKSINILKALTTTKWGKSKETITATYKTITRPILEYGSTLWSPLLADTNLQTLQTIQNTALRIASGCTADTNTTHLHQETQTLPLKTHLILHANQLKTKSTNQHHPLHSLLNQPTPPRNKKETLFLNNTYNKHMLVVSVA
jgi:hypothetical protein